MRVPRRIERRGHCCRDNCLLCANGEYSACLTRRLRPHPTITRINPFSARAIRLKAARIACQTRRRALINPVDRLERQLLKEVTMEARTQGYGTIGWSVSSLQHGHRLRRATWAPDVWVTLVPGTGQFVFQSHDGAMPWTPSSADLLAHDWALADPVQPGEYHA